MKKNGILNSDISKLLSDLGHKDFICIGDCGLPVPDNVWKIDLSLKKGTPSFIDVLEEVCKDMHIEDVILASEIKEKNKDQLDNIKKVLEKYNPNVKIKDTDFINHEDFKKKTRDAKAIIRTGEITPYSNIILISNVCF